MYEITLEALKSANNERLWFNTNQKLAKIYDKKCDSLGIRRIHVMSRAESAYYVYPIIVKKKRSFNERAKKKKHLFANSLRNTNTFTNSLQKNKQKRFKNN